MDGNRKVQRVKKRLKKRSRSSDSDDESRICKKKKYQSFREDASTASTSSSPERTDSNHNRRKYIHKESKQTHLQKGNEDTSVISHNDTDNNQQKLTTVLQKNCKMLKNEMDPTALVEKLHAIKIFDEKAVDSVKKGLNRQGKNEALIQEICSIDPKNVSLDLHTFVSLLKETKQENLASLLLGFTVSRHEMESEEYHSLMTFVVQNKEMLLEELEPLKFLDGLVEIGCFSDQEIKEIKSTPKRRMRVKLVLDKIRSNKRFASQITKCLTNAYPKLYSAFKHREYGRRTASKLQETSKVVKAGSKLNMKINIECKAVQDTQEHDDPLTTLHKKKAAAKEIERKMVNTLKEDQNLQKMFDQCLTGIDAIKLSSVKIFLTALTSSSLSKLEAFAESGAVKKLLASLIGQDGKDLGSDTEIVLEITKGNKELFADGNKLECLCHIDKESVRCLILLGIDIKCSLLVIDRFVKSDLIDVKSKAILNRMRLISNSGARSKDLLHFLLNEKLPKVFFCILEEEILKHHGSSIIRTIMKEKFTGNEIDEDDMLTSTDIRDNRELLLEELEVQWLTSVLQRKTENSTQTLLNKMMEAMSRKTRIALCLDYLVRNDDISWFAKELKKHDKHLYDTMLIRKETLSGKSKYGFNRLESAIQFYFEEMIEEIDPQMIAKWLGAKSQKKLNVPRLNNMLERIKRAECFCMSLIGAEPCTVYDVLQAMKLCGYKDIVDDITKLAREGPLFHHYRCPTIFNMENCVENCVFKKTFCLREILEGGVEEDVECFTPYINTILNRKDLVRSVIGGSESGIFSGSGPNSVEVDTDFDSDNDKKNSDIEKKQRTKEWVESQSKIVLLPKSEGKFSGNLGTDEDSTQTEKDVFLQPHGRLDQKEKL